MEETRTTEPRRRGSLRVAYICTDPGVPLFGQKGASVHVQEVVSEMVNRGATVDVFSSAPGGQSQSGFERVAILELKDWPKGGRSGVRSFVEAANGSLGSALKDRGPFDLIYERYALWSYGGMEYARSTRVPGLLEINAPLIEEEAKYRDLRNRPYAEEVARRVFLASSQIVAVSNGVARYLGGFPETGGKVHVVHNGVNPERFPRNLEPSRPSPGMFTVGFVGSLKPWHGLDTLVEAYALLNREEPRTRLLIVGDGPGKERIRQDLEARGLSAVSEFTGGVAHSEVPGLIASMDVGVAPYPKSDEFYFSPLKVFEYMAAGKPVVASEVGDLPYLIEGGVNGFLVPPGDPEALKAVLQRLMSDKELCAKVGSAGRAKVLRSHTWTTIVGKVLDLSGASARESGGGGG